MKPLAVVDCLDRHFQKVLDSDHPGRRTGEVFAVFSDSLETGQFLGLTTHHDISKHPGWIFADLVGHRDLVSTKSDASTSQAMRLMAKHNVEVLPVIDHEDCILGIVTRTSILEALLRREQRHLNQARHLNLLVGKDQLELASWAIRLSRLNETSRKLLSILAHTTVENDLLQNGIEALTDP